MANFSAIDDAGLLLCDEAEDLRFDDLAAGGSDARGCNQREEDPFDQFPVRSDESFATMVEKEREFLPRDDYPLRLRSGELELSFRRDAIGWISKAHNHFGFGPLSLCLSVNYLDRFLSLYDFPKDKAWAVQILAVACLSIAVKMEETTVPLPLELQVGEPKFLFEAKTIQRMELLVLTTLQWKMNAISPCSYVDYILVKIIGDNLIIPATAIEKTIQLILSTLRRLEFLEYRPSEIAFAASIVVADDIKRIDIDQTISDFIAHLEKDRIVSCIELMRILRALQMGGGPGRLSLGQAASAVPQSPIGVLEAKCFSNSSRSCDGTPVTSRSPANSSVLTSGNNIVDEDCPDVKRQRLDQTITILGGNSSKS